MRLTTLISYTAMIALVMMTNVASAQTRIEVSYESNFAQTGTGFAPLGAVFHDGSFGSFTPGTAASAGLEALAEGGNPSMYLAEAMAQAPTANVGSTDGQIGGSNRPNGRAFVLDVDNSNTQLSYASMFLPSNDWFIGNLGGGSLDISALLGAASGTQITIDLNTIYDAGTELEDFTRGGGTGTDPFGLVPRLSDAEGGNPDDQNDNISMVTRTPGVNLFQNFVNPNGEPIARFLPASSEQLGTITLTVLAPPLKGDADLNGVVEVDDIPAFISILQSRSFLAEVDHNHDGVVNFLDIAGFVAVLSL